MLLKKYETEEAAEEAALKVKTALKAALLREWETQKPQKESASQISFWRTECELHAHYIGVFGDIRNSIFFKKLCTL